MYITNVMPELLPRWLMKRYLVVWKVKEDKEFTFEEVSEILNDDARIISLFLSDLKKKGWLEVRIHPEDSRKRLYKLKDHTLVLKEIAEKVNA